MTAFASLLATALIAGVVLQSGPPRDDVRRQFVGHWQLVTFELFDEKGAARDAGYESGRILYDAAGNMSAQLMRTGRTRLSQPPTEAERASAYSSYTAYYGRYTIDAAESKVTHSVEGSVNPNWVKTDLVRYYEFSRDGKQLKLSLRNAQGRITGTLTWQRLEETRGVGRSPQSFLSICSSPDTPSPVC